MRISRAGDAPPRRAPGGVGLRARVLAGAAPQLASEAGMAEIDIAPGAALRAWAHDEAEALVYVVEGRARFICDGRSEEVAGGGVVRVPRLMEVAIANAGVGGLRLLVVFSPSGVERRLLRWMPIEGRHPAPGAEPRALLDLTALPRPQRQPTVIGALEALDEGTTLVVVTDHEPDALQRELERRYGPRLRWEVRERTGDRVVVAIWLDQPWEQGVETAVLGEILSARAPAPPAV